MHGGLSMLKNKERHLFEIVPFPYFHNVRLFFFLPSVLRLLHKERNDDKYGFERDDDDIECRRMAECAR